jgi:hypothetical protein
MCDVKFDVRCSLSLSPLRKAVVLRVLSMQSIVRGLGAVSKVFIVFFCIHEQLRPYTGCRRDVKGGNVCTQEDSWFSSSVACSAHKCGQCGRLLVRVPCSFWPR